MLNLQKQNVPNTHEKAKIFFFCMMWEFSPVATLEYKRLPETIYLHSRLKTAVLKLSMHNLQMEPFALVEKIVLVSSTSLRVH